jgi:hypothetical protein
VTSFDINHDGYLDINEQLLQAVRRMGDIIQSLNAHLASIPSAVWGGPLPIWEGNQRIWNAEYEEMTTKINGHTISSINIHDIFKQGDYNGTRIMLQ